jgi:AraC-like DNA-binding protein
MLESNQGYNNFRIAVQPAYEEVFTHFYFAENKSGEAITKTLLPSYQTILIFSFGTTPFLFTQQLTKIDVVKCIVLGPVKQAFDYTLPAGAEILTVNFKDDAFYRFFGNAAIAEHVPLDPDDLLNEGCFNMLWNELSKTNDINQRVDRLLKFCDPYLLYRNQIAQQLANFNDKNLDPIKTIANANNQTERNTQLNYKKHFGYSAKELNRYERFLKAIDLIQQLASNRLKIDWFEVISECGYYDQSQLIHDFKHYISLSPAKYLKFQQDICNPVT